MTMIQWQELPRSIRYSANGFTADVWAFMTTKKVYKFTVINENGHYVECGIKNTQDEACEAALEAMKV